MGVLIARRGLATGAASALVGGVVAACSLAHPLSDIHGTRDAAAAGDPSSIAHCNDGAPGPGESDVDCGGECPPCGIPQGCASDNDCVSHRCAGKTCACPNGMTTADKPSPSNGARQSCIDATEVTNADYKAFLDGCAADVRCLAGLGLRGSCAWKTSYAPDATGACATTFDPVGRAAYPVVCVDWCDAFAFCRANGKRLCNAWGAPGPFAQSWYDSEWLNACSFGGTFDVPYGNATANTFDPSYCNGPHNGATLAPIASFSTCVGGYPALYDMSGNAFEWEDACQREEGDGDLCRVRGGSFLGSEDDLQCAANTTRTRGARAPDVGFRCCAG